MEQVSISISYSQIEAPDLFTISAISLSPNATIAQLKEKTADITGYQKGTFVLSFNKIFLEDDEKTLASFNISNDAIINLSKIKEKSDDDFGKIKIESKKDEEKISNTKEEQHPKTEELSKQENPKETAEQAKPDLEDPKKIHEEQPSKPEDLSKQEKISKKAKVCGICLDESQSTEEIGCDHCYCKSCLEKFLSSEFDEKRKSFLDLKCPAPWCGKTLTQETITKHVSETTLKNYNSVMKTIPNNPEDPNLKIDDFFYKYDERGRLVHSETGDSFHWVNQLHYDLLGDLIIQYLQERMKTEFKMQELFLPEKSTLPPHVRNNIFMTQDALTNPHKLMLLIQGSGAVRPGMWARALCINDTLDNGSIFPYLRKAIADGYGVIVFNPNQNRVPVDGFTRPKREEFFTSGKPKYQDVKEMKIPENESPPQHTINVWNHYGSIAAARKIVIVAHSAGGSCTMSLLREKGNEILPKLKAIAFTDSVHSESYNDSKSVQNFLKNNARNWVQSNEPLDTPVRQPGQCKCVSAGHTKHEFTSGSAVESVFKFLKEKTR